MSGLTAIADNGGMKTSDPQVLSRIADALENSGIAHLTSKISTHEGQDYSYHLKTIDYLGTIRRDGTVFTIAAAKFLRSSGKGADTSPARGHGFLLMIDPDFDIASHARISYRDFRLRGGTLRASDGDVLDFFAEDLRTRYRGWLVDGDFLPYPFKDKISEADWNAGTIEPKTNK